MRIFCPFGHNALTFRQLAETRSPVGGRLFTSWRKVVHQLAESECVMPQGIKDHEKEGKPCRAFP